MNKTNGAINSKHGLSKLMRPRFGPGMLLQHEDLEQLNVYTRELSRLMFQSLFGCGVMCGLVVSTEEKCGKMTVKVEKGVALACSGDPVYVPEDVNVPLVDDCNGEVPDRIWVVLCGTVKCCSPRTSICSSDDDDAASDCTREKDGWEIRLVNPRPPCACGCEEPKTPGEDRVGQSECKCVILDPAKPPYFKCYEAHYAGKCGCDCADCSDCDCQCILLARVDRKVSTNEWTVDHRVRRFVRPVLMRDPQIEKENEDRAKPAETTDPQTAALFEQLSDQNSEKEMLRIRLSWNSFSEREKAQVRNILELYPEQEKAYQFQQILNKYHDVKLGPNVPLQTRNLSSKLTADLAEARKRNQPLAKSRKKK